MKTCTQIGCERRHKGRGFCELHLRRVRTHGAPDVVGAPGPRPAGNPQQCSAAGCEKSTRSATAELCDMHRSRLRRTGRLEGTTTKTEADRFWSHVDRSGSEGSCWEWTGSRNSDGYGRFADVTRRGAKLAAHRVSYTISVGPIPDGLTIDHLCRNKACVNPRHLEAVPLEENIRRAFRWRTHCKHGHEFTPENTYRREHDRRVCRACHAARQAARRAAA